MSRALILPSSLIIVSLFITTTSFSNLQHIHTSNSPQANSIRETLYLPNGQALGFMSFGYAHALSHLLWFQTINYFGKHYRAERNYYWLGHMCNLVIDLNSSVNEIFDFCALMLAWEANSPNESIEILNKAIIHHPKEWKFYYLRAMTYYLFLNDLEHAKDDFLAASKLPGVHVSVVRIAAKKLSLTDSPETARLFLEDMIEKSKNKMERKALQNRLKELRGGGFFKRQNHKQPKPPSSKTTP